MKKKILILCAAMLMMFGVSMSANAETYGDLNYQINSNNTVTITGRNSSVTEVVIPSEIEGLPVTSISEEAFAWCNSLTSITIPDSVTSIGPWAFYRCTELESVYISDVSAWCNITFKIGSYNTYRDDDYIGWSSNPLYYANKLYLNNKRVVSVEIPDGVTTIPKYVFACDSLKTITIPTSVTSIDLYAFNGCENLESVYISDISAWCNIEFYSTPMLYANNLYLDGKLVTELTIPSGVTSIACAFLNCESLTSIIIPDSITRIGNKAFSGCSNLTSITIPDSVTSIGEQAFLNCDSLTSITIPDSVTSIGDHAFFECDALVSITIPNSITSIDDYTFSYCDSLTSITIPDSVTSIGHGAFYACNSLTSITIPDSVTSIGDYTFSECSNLESITIGKGVTSFGQRILYRCYNLKTVYYNASKVISDIFDVGYYGEDYKNISCIVLGNNVKTIETSAFSDCKELEKILIPKGVTEINNNAFENCSKLTTVEYGGSEEDSPRNFVNFCLQKFILIPIFHLYMKNPDNTFSFFVQKFFALEIYDAIGKFTISGYFSKNHLLIVG